jgi:PAS domain S-box-containing protein
MAQRYQEDSSRANGTALNEESMISEGRERQSWLSAMFDCLSAGIISTRSDGKVQFLNPAAEVLTGWRAADAIGRPIEDIYSVREIDGSEELQVCQLRKALASRMPTGRQRFMLTTQSGWCIPIEDSASPILDGPKLLGAVTIFTDIAREITDEKTASGRQNFLSGKVKSSPEALDRSNRQFVSLAGRLIDAQEEERRRIARELHDDFAQRTALIGLLVDRITVAGEQFPADLHTDLELLKSMVDDLTEGLRDVSHRLHPAIISDLGLSQALLSLVRDYRALGVDLASSIEEVGTTIPLTTATALYRIAQEALHNSLRHAAGAPVMIYLRLVTGKIELRIEDAGPGFSLVHAEKGLGLGLLSMQERAGTVGGNLLLNTKPGEGTVVLVTAPLTAHGKSTPNPARRRSPING